MPELKNVTVRGVLVDDADLDLERYKWHLGAQNRVQTSTYDSTTQRTGKLKMHRIIAARMEGRELLRSEEVDHINGNPMDNRRSNLRIASHAENQRNQKSHGGLSRYVGVGYNKALNKWVAHITFDYKGFAIGLFSDEHEAASIRDQWAMELHGEFARLNFDYIEVATQEQSAA